MSTHTPPKAVQLPDGSVARVSGELLVTADGWLLGYHDKLPKMYHIDDEGVWCMTDLCVVRIEGGRIVADGCEYEPGDVWLSQEAASAELRRRKA